MEINTTFYDGSAGPARECQVLNSQMFPQPSKPGEDEIDLGEFPDFQFYTLPRIECKLCGMAVLQCCGNYCWKVIDFTYNYFQL